MRRDPSEFELLTTFAVGLAWAMLGMSVLGAYGTSIVDCILKGQWPLLVGDLCCPPVAIVHGVGVWFGAWP